MTSFIEEAIGDADLRIDAELGHGFVRLKVSEAEKRQAAQDIRSSEDIVIELLRNARDAGAAHIFLATQREGDERSISVIDDGGGIPADMHERIFEPRVTSKLDTASMDRWGLHGRGMALYSIRMNADRACVAASESGLGSAICVTTDLRRVGEKRDQSTFPTFEEADGKMSMRGPKNMLRTAAEFALEHRAALDVRIGSFTEIAAALYGYGTATVSPAARAFDRDVEGVRLVQRLAFAADPQGFCEIASTLGLPMSERSARRIMDGGIEPARPLAERLRAAYEAQGAAQKAPVPSKGRKGPCAAPKLSQDDIDAFAGDVAAAYRQLARRYYLDGEVEVRARLARGTLTVEIPVVEAP